MANKHITYCIVSIAKLKYVDTQSKIELALVYYGDRFQNVFLVCFLIAPRMIEKYREICAILSFIPPATKTYVA